MIINIPCVDCIHFSECGARRVCIKDLLYGKLTCYDCDNGQSKYGRPDHKNSLGSHLFNRNDGRYLLPETEEELKSLNEEYLNALRPNILQLLQICVQLLHCE